MKRFIMIRAAIEKNNSKSKMSIARALILIHIAQL